MVDAQASAIVSVRRVASSLSDGLDSVRDEVEVFGDRTKCNVNINTVAVSGSLGVDLSNVNQTFIGDTVVICR